MSVDGDNWRAAAKRLETKAPPTVVPLTPECEAVLGMLRADELVELHSVASRLARPAPAVLDLVIDAWRAGHLRIYVSRIAK